LLTIDLSLWQIIRTPDEDIRSSGDKLRRMNDNRALQAASRRNTDVLTVYIGDSSTDFDCLCEADVGIWLYDVPEEEYTHASQKVFAPLNYVPPPLKTLTNLEDDMAMFYWAPDFQTVLVALSLENDDE
jgi:hypothetical protein